MAGADGEPLPLLDGEHVHPALVGDVEIDGDEGSDESEEMPPDEYAALLAALEVQALPKSTARKELESKCSRLVVSRRCLHMCSLLSQISYGRLDSLIHQRWRL